MPLASKPLSSESGLRLQHNGVVNLNFCTSKPLSSESGLRLAHILSDLVSINFQTIVQRKRIATVENYVEFGYFETLPNHCPAKADCDINSNSFCFLNILLPNHCPAKADCDSYMQYVYIPLNPLPNHCPAKADCDSFA